MKKILLIEDRTKRQLEFMKKFDIVLENYSTLENAVGEKYYEFLKLFDKEELDLEYEIIITHQSAFGQSNINIINKLIRYITKTKKKIVFFSGGLTTPDYKKESYERLSINAETFYSKNLKLFLDSSLNNEEDILQLAYGKNYKLVNKLGILENISNFLVDDKDKIVYFGDFLDDTKINSLEIYKNLSKGYKNNDKLQVVDIEKIYDNLARKIKEEVIFDV